MYLTNNDDYSRGNPSGIREIESLTPAFSNGEGDWYDLSGRKYGSTPNKPGIYIVGGRKVVIK